MGDENPVERIFVDQRQRVNGNSMFTGDRQFAVSIVFQTPAQYPGIDMKISPAEATFDGNLPKTCGAENQFVFRIFDQSTSSMRETVRIAGGPQEQLNAFRQVREGIKERILGYLQSSGAQPE